MTPRPRGAPVRRIAASLAASLAALLLGMGSPAAAGPDGPAPVLPGAPLASLSATRDRPLFAPTRRPPPAPRPAAAAPQAPPKPASVEEPPRFALLGIVRAPDGGGSAVLLDEAGRASFSLKRGEARRGWVLESLDADAVTLVKDRRPVRLTYPKAPGAPQLPAK